MDKINLNQNTPEWLSFRRSRIGASDTPIIMGVSPWKTPKQLWEEKLGFKENESNFSMQRGHELEPIARAEFERHTGYKVETATCISSERPWMMASLDGIDETGKIIVEIKCPSNKAHQQALNKIVPDYYMPQLQHQMYVCELESMFYFSFDGCEGIAFKVERDDKMINLILSKNEYFYECLQECKMPALTDKDYNNVVDNEWSLYSEQLKVITLQKKDLESKEKMIKDKLIKMANEQSSKGNGISLCKYPRRGNIDYTLIPELQGLDLEQFRKPAQSCWRFSIE